MTLDKIRTGTGRKLRTEGLQETALPIPYDAATMPGATVLGTDGQLYSSTKDADGDYQWYFISRLTATGALLLGVDIEISSIVNNATHSLRLQIADDANEASASFTRFVDTANPPRFHFQRGRGTLAAREAIGQANTTIGQVIWSGWDGSQWANAVRIQALNDAASAAQSMPGLLQVFTSPAGSRIPNERLRINSSGNVLIGNTSGTERLSVTGNIQLTDTADSYKVGTNNVVGARKTGWTAPTGTATRTTFDTTTVTTEQLAERVKALIDDLTSHGLIGA